jgi:hypothetical protein
VIANSPKAVVRFESFLESFNQSSVICVAKVLERKNGRALELLNSSIKDKIFDRNVSRITGVPLNVSVGNWSAYTTYSTRGSDSSNKKSPQSKITTST